MNRRKYLAAIGTVTSLALAGCSGGTGGNNSSAGNRTKIAGNGAETTATNTETRTGRGDTTTTDTETETATEAGAEAETDTEMATKTEMQTATPSGGGEGSLEVVKSELVVDEGQYTTDIAMTGLLENTGSGVLRIPEIEVTFYDDSDSVLSNTTRSIVFLQPGDQWDVRVSYLEDTNPARGEIEVVSAEVYQTELGIPAPLELTEENLETGAEPTITATLQNTSNSPVDAVAFGVFYAEDSVALGGALDTLNGLAGGESWSVTLESLITREERAQRVTDYTLYANVP